MADARNPIWSARRSLVSCLSVTTRPLIPSSFAWNVAAILPDISLSNIMSTIPFVSTPRTIFRETLVTLSPTRTGMEYCSFFAKVWLMESFACIRRISRTSMLVTSSLEIIVFITFSATFPNVSWTSANALGSETASPKSSIILSLIASISSAVIFFSRSGFVLSSPKICRNSWLRFAIIDWIALTFIALFGRSNCSNIR